MHRKLLQIPIAAAALAATGVAHAAVINVDTTKSGRQAEETIGEDNTFGDPGAFETDFTTNNALVGDNPSNHEFFGLYAYEVTTVFANDYNADFDVLLDISSGAINNGTPGSLDLYVLQVSNKTSGKDVTDDAVAGGLVTTFSGTSTNQPYQIDITTQLDAASGGTLSAGQIIWLGIDPTQTTNGVADNIRFGNGGGSGNAMSSTLTTVIPVIPEPASLALLGLGGLCLLGRSRRS